MSDEENIEKLKRLLYTGTLTQYGKRKLINYYEEKIEKLQKENELAKQALIENCNIADERNQLLKENEELKKKLKEEEKLNKIIKNTKLDKLLNISRNNGKTIELAMQLKEEILKLPKCRLYGIKNCKNKRILLIKEECIPIQKVKDKIEEYKRDMQNLDTYPNFSEQEVYRETLDVLQELLEEREEKIK